VILSPQAYAVFVFRAVMREFFKKDLTQNN
jgi:hypothetical protein